MIPDLIDTSESPTPIINVLSVDLIYYRASLEMVKSTGAQTRREGSHKKCAYVYLRSFWLKFMALKRCIVLFNPFHSACVSEVIIAHDSGLD